MNILRPFVAASALATALSVSAAEQASVATKPTALKDLTAQLVELKQRVQQLEAALSAQSQATAATTPASAPTATSSPALAQKVAAIERKLEVQAEESIANRIKMPQVALGDKGLAVTTPDGNFEMKLRGYVQFDSRFWLADNHDDDTNSFLFRRVRPIIEGTVYKNFYYRLMADFASNAVTLQDGYGEWRQFPFARLGFGKMKSPVGLEQLASAAELEFVERGLPRNLVPNRDFGVQLTGDLFGERLNYTVGVFNGVPDLASIGASDTNDDKDFVGRLFALPFKSWYGPLQGLGIGISGTYGKEEFSLAASAVTPNLASYVTPGQQRFFRYRTTSAATGVTGVDGKTVSVPLVTVLANTTVADGSRYRVMPQAYWYWRQFGLFGETVESGQEVAFGAHRDTLANDAWQLQGFWVLTGEDATYRGVKPRRDFDPSAGAWGAWELVARYSDLQIDKDAFRGVTATGAGTAFADPRQSASRASAWALGLNWYLNRNFKVNLDYENTWFNGGGGGSVRVPLDRETERVFLTRFQIAY